LVYKECTSGPDLTPTVDVATLVLEDANGQLKINKAIFSAFEVKTCDSSLLQDHRSAMVERKANFALDLESTPFTADQVNAFLAAYANGYFKDEDFEKYAIADACITFVGAPGAGTGTFCGKEEILAGLSKFDKSDKVKIVGTVKVMGDALVYKECTSGPDLTPTVDVATLVLEDANGQLKINKAIFSAFEVKTCK